MKNKWCLVFLMSFLLLIAVSPPVEARTMIYDILAKGSQWTLNVDGEVGTLELLGGRGSRTRDGGWVMTMEIKWQNNPGTLRAQADGKNAQQHVVLYVERKNGLKVNCEGYIAMETNRFMAGITRHPARPKDLHGAWYATVLKKGRKPGQKKPEVTPAITSRPIVIREKVKKVLPAVKVKTGTCSISGKVYGSGSHAAKVFHVSLYGPDDLNLHRETKKFDPSGAYMFTGLPNGRYRLIVDTKADIAIGPHPPERIVQCSGGAVKNVNFQLK